LGAAAIHVIMPVERSWPHGGIAMLLLLINILIIVVIGALCFYLIDRFVRDGRLGNLLKILVALICIAAILQRLLPALGVGSLL
jgi:hypothetical protein